MEKEYSIDDYLEAKTSLLSLIKKSEKALLKLAKGTGPYTYLQHRIETFYLCMSLLEEKVKKIQ